MREIRGCSVIVAARGQVEQDRVGKYEFSALLPENQCCLCLCLHTTCAAADHIHWSLALLRCCCLKLVLLQIIYRESCSAAPENLCSCSCIQLVLLQSVLLLRTSAPAVAACGLPSKDQQATNARSEITNDQDQIFPITVPRLFSGPYLFRYHQKK